MGHKVKIKKKHEMMKAIARPFGSGGGGQSAKI